MSAWEAQGLNIVMVELMVNDPDDGPPTLTGVQQWRDEFGLNNIHVAADPTISMAVGGSIGTPTATIIDPRTMLVHDRFQGSGEGAFASVEALANQNRVQ